MSVHALVLGTLLTGGAQAKEDPLATLTARVDRYAAALSSPSCTARIAVLNEWSKAAHEDQKLLNATQSFNRSNQHLDPEACRKAINSITERIANLISKSLDSNDPAEFRAALHWHYSQHSRFRGNSWRWPTCGNHEPYITDGVDAEAALRRRPDWAAKLLYDPDPDIVGYVATSLQATQPDLVRTKSLNWILGSKPKLRSIALLLLDVGPFSGEDYQEPKMDADMVRLGLGDQDREIRGQVLDDIQSCPEQRRTLFIELRRNFQAESPERKWSTLNLAASYHDKSLIASANQLRASVNTDLRCETLRYLFIVKQPISTDEVRFSIQNADPDWHRSWIFEAGNHPDMWPDLVRMLNVDEDSQDAWTSLCHLATMQNISFLVETFAHRKVPCGYSFSESSLSYALGKLGDPAAAIVRRFYTSSDVANRRIAVDAACYYKQTGLTDILDACIRDKDSGERKRLAQEIHWRGRAIAWPRLQLLLRDQDESVRIEAIEAMGDVALESDFPFLKDLARSEDKQTSQSAIEALNNAKERLHPSE